MGNSASALPNTASCSKLDAPPVDRFLLTYVICILLGTGTLLPWNVFITETAYFSDRFHVEPFNHLMANNFINFMAVSYQLFNFLGLVIVVRFKLGERLPMKYQVMWPLILGSILMGLTCALVEVTGISGNAMIAVTLPSCAMLGFFAAVLCGGVFALASFLPAAYTQAVMTGQGVAGLGVSLTSMLTLLGQAATDDSSDDAETHYKVEPNAFSYFLVAFLDLLLCLLGYFFLNRILFFRYHANANAKEIANYVNEVTNTQVESGDLSGLQDPLLMDSSQASLSLRQVPGSPRTPGGRHASSSAQQLTNAQMYRISVMLNFFGTLVMFPGITSLIDSSTDSSNRFYNDLFVPFSFVVFNATDLMGRMGSGWCGAKPPAPRKILMWTSLRLLALPVFLFCNVKPAHGGNWGLPLLFESDVFPNLFNSIMGFSNGLLGSLCMMHAPSFVHPSQRQDEGTKMALSLIAGCTLGSFTSLVITISLG